MEVSQGIPSSIVGLVTVVSITAITIEPSRIVKVFPASPVVLTNTRSTMPSESLTVVVPLALRWANNVSDNYPDSSMKLIF